MNRYDRVVTVVVLIACKGEYFCSVNTRARARMYNVWVTKLSVSPERILQKLKT